jgi:hypothetical protein
MFLTLTPPCRLTKHSDNTKICSKLAKHRKMTTKNNLNREPRIDPCMRKLLEANCPNTAGTGHFGNPANLLRNRSCKATRVQLSTSGAVNFCCSRSRRREAFDVWHLDIGC